MRSKLILGVIVTLAILGGASATHGATFNSGSTGANGAFPPSPPATYTEMRLDLAAGNVQYYNGSTLVSTVALPGGSGGFPTGVLNFTTIDVPAGKTLKFLRNASNTPVTLLAQTTVNINGTLDVAGQPGRPGVAATSFDDAGGPGGPGGFDGGAGGNNVAASGGGRGLGPGGGLPEVPVSPAVDCSGAGASYATAGLRGHTGGVFCATVGATYGNPQLLPLVGGSGGAGGSVNPSSRTGGSGGGALLIAASGTITLTGTVAANGGNAGANIPNQSNSGGGGSGGAVRLVATTLTGTGGTISVIGGNGLPGNLVGIGGLGRVRLEAYTNTLTVTFPGHPLQTAAVVIPSVTSPGAVALASGPTLRIASIAGINSPTYPTGSYALPDITVPATTVSPVTVVVTATNVPAGTPVVLRATPLTGAATTATTPGLSGGTASANLAADLTQPNVVSGEATFNLAGWFDSPIKYAGEEVTTVKVVASLGGESVVRYFTASGNEVPAEASLRLGLPR